jgi:hypothetical protein
MPLLRRAAPACLIAASAAAVISCSAPAVSGPPPSPSSVPASSGITLTGISCASASYCVAVGVATVSQARVLPVAEAWNGQSWSGQAVPGPTGTATAVSRLDAVSCSGPSRCVAVGGTTTASGDVAFADSWNGTRWQLLPLDYPAGSTDLTGVSCRVSTCLLTGLYLTGGQERPLAFELDGAVHRRLAPALPRGQAGASLAGVWCATPSACMTVGSYEPAREPGTANTAEEWDGSRWQVLKTAAPASIANGPGLVSVACPSTALCLAAGAYNDVSRPGRPFAVREIWQHGQWRMLHPSGPEPQRFTPAAVACQSSSSCIVVGSVRPSALTELPGAEQWTGGSLRYLPIPQPQGGFMTAISCTSSLMCLAIGDGATAFGELWNGSSWRLLSIPR